MKKIIVATDFSPAATNAAKYAADLALAIRADLYLLHVYQIPVVYLEIPVALAADDIQDDAERNMKKLKEELLSKSNGQFQIETAVKEGNFYDELKTACEYIQPYSVVLGSQGKTQGKRI
jgi:nucleotide-binding universal stress UspA family protein